MADGLYFVHVVVYNGNLKQENSCWQGDIKEKDTTHLGKSSRVLLLEIDKRVNPGVSKRKQFPLAKNMYFEVQGENGSNSLYFRSH